MSWLEVFDYFHYDIRARRGKDALRAAVDALFELFDEDRDGKARSAGGEREDTDGEQREYAGRARGADQRPLPHAGAGAWRLKDYAWRALPLPHASETVLPAEVMVSGMGESRDFAARGKAAADVPGQRNRTAEQIQQDEKELQEW